ncbi:MAG: dCMP deaminase [Candidatus Melainabacteria bacterium]|nr:MAG: dCMP deaminase [Candidatus Melainabacteria bacterium]
MTKIDDRDWLLKAIDLSRRCPLSQKAFCVGAIIIGAKGDLISTGFSRERNPREHAEETAINKAIEQRTDLTAATIYTSLEPCSPRLSGSKSCTDLIIDCGIKRVVFALYEPPVFVACNGADRLREHRIEVVVMAEFAELVEEINKPVCAEK